MRRSAFVALLGLLLCAGAARAEDFRDAVDVKPGGTLTVDLAMGSLEIETHDEPRVEVEASTRGWAGGLELTLTGDGRDAKLVGVREGLPFGAFGARVRARVPEEFSLDLETRGGTIQIEAVRGRVRARTSGGSIQLEGAEGPVDLYTSGGSIGVEQVRGDTTVRTSGGSIRIEEVTGLLDVETSGGSIRLSDIDGPIRANTSGGSITARYVGSGAGDIRTSGGSIEVELPEDANLDLEAETSGGRVEIDGELTISGALDRSHVKGRIGAGGERLELHTSGGNIRVRAR